MIINKKVIGELDPCQSRFNNYKLHYKSKSFSFDEFLNLDKITYSDKIWVAQRLLNENQLIHFGLLCTESVLYIFEEKYPLDKRVRDCIEPLKGIKDFSNMSVKEKNTVTNAVYDTNAVYVTNAAVNAAYAAYARTQQQKLNLEYLKMAATL